MTFSRATKVVALILVCLASIIMLAACASQSATPTPTTPAPVSTPPPASQTPPSQTTPPAQTTPKPEPVTVKVNLSGLAFSPATVNVPVGATVIWTNKDSVPHTVTSNTGAFGSQTLSSGSTFSFTFTQAGTFQYHCNIHPSMTGKIIVGAGTTTPSGGSTTPSGGTTTPPAVGTTTPPSSGTTAPPPPSTAGNSTSGSTSSPDYNY